MKALPKCPPELQPLLLDLIDPTGDVDHEHLERVLRDSDPARVFYLQYMQLHAELQLLADSPLTSPLSSQFSADQNSEHKLPAPPRPWWRALTQPKFSHAAVTALLMISAGLAVLAILKVPALRSPPAVDQTSPVAQLTATHESFWVGDSPTLRQQLHAGEELQLRSGQAELTFADGAVVVFSGPARIRIDSAGSCTLFNGDAIAEAPESAGGFTIHTPTAVIVDLGTRFAVSVGEEGATEVHVFQGQVAVQPGGTQDEGEPAGVRQLAAGAAVSIDRSLAFEEIDCAPQRFVRRTPYVVRAVAHQAGGLLRSDQRVVMGGNSDGVRRIGSSSEEGISLVSLLLFRLPDLDDPQDIEAVRLNFTYRAMDGDAKFAVDLYGLGYTNDASVDAEWFYEGDDDPRSSTDYGTGTTATPVPKLGVSVLAPTTVTGRISIRSPDLTDFIKSQYASGATAGNFVVFRLNAHSSTGEGTRQTGYNIVHAPAIVGRTYPHEVATLTITTGKEANK